MINTQTTLFEDNTVKNDYFPEIIAQEKPKSALSLHIDGYRINKFLPPIGLISPRGMGKSEFLTSLSKNLTDKDNKPKPFLHLNCASVKNLSALVDQIFIPYQNKDVTFGFDEAHLLPKDAMGWMLNTINPNKNRKSFNYHNGIRLDWDFYQTSFLFCSTNPERFSEPFISRLERVDLEEYKDIDLVKILHKNAPDINFNNNVELDIVSVCRGTPREVVKLADKIKQFCEVKKQNTFDAQNWKELKERANINYLGLNSYEIQHLFALKEYGELTLTMLAAKLMLDRTTVQRDIEKFLLKHSLININQKRTLSENGYNTVNILKGLTT